jgi:hypothetical protein
MKLKVYNTDTEKVETIDATAFDAKIHKHRNTREDFIEADIAGFA